MAASATFVKVGPCTDTLDPRTQTVGMACVGGESRHESMHPSGQSLQTNLGDGCTRKCVFALTSWTGACAEPGSRFAGPRLAVTHHLSWAQWSRGCKPLPSYRLEGPARPRPSPGGLRSLSVRQGHRCFAQRWSGCPWTWGDAGQTESHSRVWWCGWASETGWGALARLPDTVQAGPTEPQTYPGWGSEVEHRDSTRETLRWPEVESAWAAQHLPGSREGQREWEKAWWRLRITHHWLLAKREGKGVARCLQHVAHANRALLWPRDIGNCSFIENVGTRNRKETKDSPPGPPPGEGVMQTPSPEEQILPPLGRLSQGRLPLRLPPGLAGAWTGWAFPLRPAACRLGGGCCLDWAGAEAAAGGRPWRRADGGAAADDWVEAAAGRRGRMCLIASVCFCATENCWAKFSTASPKRPAWQTGALRNRTLSGSCISARFSHRWCSWTTKVDIARPREHAVTFAARRVRSVAVRSSCITPGSELPSCSSLSALAW